MVTDLGPQSATDSAPALYFYHPDHLGSTAMVTDLDGRITQNVVYIPYGEVFVEERNGSWASPYLFNAKELDEETGLYYYGARYLDPAGARWLSVDPMFEKYMGMSPYNYCAGNPVKMVDPDGRENLFFLNLKNPDNLAAYYNGIQHDESGVINVYCHSEENRFLLLDIHPISPIEFMSYVKQQSDEYQKNKNENKSSIIVLHACESGDGLGSSAQQLSDIYKEDIFVAPNGIVNWKVDLDFEKETGTPNFENAYKVQNIVTKETVKETKDGRPGAWNVFKGGVLIGEIPGDSNPTKEAINEVIRQYDKNNN